MSKEEFIQILNNEISYLPDHNDIISYYYELISDKVDAGYTEEEAIDSLGDINELVKSIKENSSKSEEVKKEEVIVTEKEENNDYEQKENKPKELHGGKKFVYVLWNIATVLFCIISVCILVASCALLFGGIAASSASIYVFTKDIMVGMFVLGAGLLILGASIVALVYSIVLVKYIFGSRLEWINSMRKALLGE